MHHQLPWQLTCPSTNSRALETRWADWYADKAFGHTWALTLDLAELQVVESVGGREKNDSQVGAQGVRSCAHNSLSLEAVGSSEI